jgi:hypothetical protein
LLNIFKGVTYTTSCSFSDIVVFFDVLQPFLTKVQSNKTDFLKNLNIVIEDWGNLRSGYLSENDVMRYLISSDLRSIKKNLQGKTSYDLTESLSSALLQYENILKKQGLDFDTPRLYFVNSYPSPFDNLQGRALTIDLNDKKSFGIQPGIYMRYDDMLPFYSESLLAHELIHWVISQPNPSILARGLEEGICDLIGTIYLTSKLLGAESAKNIFIHERLYVGKFNQFWENYLEASRQGAVIYFQRGLNGLFELIAKGRSAIRQAEANLITGNINLDKAKNKKDEMSDLILYLLFSYPRYLAVSPLAKFISEYVETGLSYEEISNNSHIPKPLVQQALIGLEEDFFLLLLDRKGQRVKYSGLSDTIRKVLRYKIE